jgi:hypothetical protein
MSHPIISTASDSHGKVALAFLTIVKKYFSKDILRRLVLAGLFGSLVGCLCWFFFKNYTSELTLALNTNVQSDNVLDSFSQSDFERIQWGLSKLADRAVQDGIEKEIPGAKFSQMRKKDWWRNNLSAVYATPIDSAKSRKLVSALIVHGSGLSSQDALDISIEAAEFLRVGGAYLEVQNILDRYRSELSVGKAKNDMEILKTRLKISYLQSRIDGYENLLVQNSRLFFPRSSPRGFGGGLDYSTVNNQIFVESSELLTLRNLLASQLDLHKKFALMEAFFLEVNELSIKTVDGLVLSRELIGILDRLRQRSSLALVEELFLNEIQVDLVKIQFRFFNGLKLVNQISKRSGLFRAISLGAIIAIFLSLVPIFVRKFSLNE